MIWGLSLHGWEDVMRGSLAVVGVAGLLVGLATFFVVTLQREEISESKMEIEEYKVEAGKEVETAKASGASALERAATAELRAADANLKLAKLMASRSLSPEQQLRLVEKLKLFAGQKYSFNVFPDPEPINLLRLIDGVLRTAGWVRIDSQVGDIVIDGAGTAHDSGIGIGIKRETPGMTVVIAQILADALTAEELPAGISYIAELKFTDAININVGKKP